MKVKKAFPAITALSVIALGSLAFARINTVQTKADGDPVDIPGTPDYIYVCLDNSPWAQWHNLDSDIRIFTWGKNGDNVWPGVNAESTETIGGRLYGKFATTFTCSY